MPNPYKVSTLDTATLPAHLVTEIKGIKDNSNNWDVDLYDIFEANDKVIYEAAKNAAPKSAPKPKAKPKPKAAPKKPASKKPIPLSKAKSRYKGVFGDYDNDGILNVDDPNPQKAGDKQTVEEVKLSDEIAALITYRESQDSIRKEFVAKVEKLAKGEEEVLSRTKTPFSIINKLRRKRLVSKIDAKSGAPKTGVQGLTDVIGAMVVFKTQAKLEAFKKQVKSGDLGKVVEFDDYYATDHAGYKAYHFNLIYKGAPVELQLKTSRMKKLGIANHELYKTGKGDASLFKALTDAAEMADAGDEEATKRIDPILKDAKKLEHHLLNEKINVPGLSVKKLDKVWGKYFDLSDGKHEVLKLSSLRSEKKNPMKSKIIAINLMHEAGAGKRTKRKPISVKKVGAKYVVQDGNATLAAARYSDWEGIPAIVEGAAKKTKSSSAPDGWRTHLIKARSYAIKVMTAEELDAAKSKGMDWSKTDSVVSYIDKHLSSVGTKPHANRTPRKRAQAAKAGAKGFMAAELTKAKRGDFKHFTREQILEKAQTFQKSRSKAGQTRDEAGDSKKRLSPTPENLVRWMNNPGGFDLIGIDTYKKGDATANLKIRKEVWWNRIGLKLK